MPETGADRGARRSHCAQASVETVPRWLAGSSLAEMVKAAPVSVPEGPSWWVEGARDDRLAPWGQAKLWALHRVNQELGLGMDDAAMAELVQKPNGESPSKQAVQKFRAAIEADPAWYPGKGHAEGAKTGPKPRFTKAKQLAVARCAMALKEADEEPTVAAVVQKCPVAAVNPDTGLPFDGKLVLRVFRTLCFDSDPAVPWDQDYPLAKTALSPELKEWRLKWAKTVLAMAHAAGWWRRHAVSFDPCHTIVPGTAKKAFDIQQASYGKGRRWISKDSKQSSRNLRAAPYATKQTNASDTKIHFIVGVARGKVFVRVMEDGWAPNGAGMARFVTMLPAILSKVADAAGALPRVLVTDRGSCFYHGATGHLVKAYQAAVDEEGFRSFAGDDGSWQPPDIPDVLVHETVVAWFRNYLRKHPWKLPGNPTAARAKFAEVAKDFVKHANKNYEVEALCESMPKRLQDLVDKKGERLKH